MKRLLASFIGLIGFITTLQAQVIAQDSLSLVAIYQATSGATWTDRTNWLQGPVSTWYGVAVWDKRVRGLDLWNNGLLGHIPDEIGSLTEIIELNLGTSKMEGPIPPSIGQLKELNVLNLRRSGIQGKIPASLANCTKLGQLYLGENRLEGEIDSSFARCIQLAFLHLNKNQLTGGFPSFIFKLPKLYSFSIDNNLFSGPLPAALNRLTNLNYIGLSNNQFEGPMPKLDSLINLETISFNNNKLSGNLENILGYYPKMRYCLGNNNAFTGLFSSRHFNPVVIIQLDFYNNKITELGSFANWAANSNFINLNVINNKLDFDDLVPNAALPGHKLWWFPQLPIGLDTTIRSQAGTKHTINSTMKNQNIQYRWFHNGNLLSNASGPQFIIPSLNQVNAGNYTYQATHPLFENEYYVQSTPINILLQTTAIAAWNNSEVELVYRPGVEAISIIVYPPLKIKGCRIFNGYGQLYLSKVLKGSYSTISISEFPTGAYFIELVMDDRRYVKKILKL